ncbi:MAG: Gfo/Idh/MocA family oxidoreductase [Flavobacteriales bacterium]|nr:Gfo/Idh/MocA family oxidoreductase [Flavobacteriales bacterium]
MLKIGVLGAGHLGKIHIRLLAQSEKYELVGFYDPMTENAKNVSQDLGVKAWDDINALIDAVDVVDVVTPTTHHFECVMSAIEKGKHVFVEKPIAFSMEQAQKMIDALHDKGLKGQVGHVERFNPAFTAVRPFINKPAFIEAHRLSEFNPRGTDVPVVLDLMIHDLDAILSIVDSPVKTLTASGACVISDTPDIANARIEFENGCVANLTTSRISMKNMRKTRIFQRDAYIAVNFLKKEAEIFRMHDAPANPDPYSMILTNAEGKSKQIVFDKPEAPQNNAILDELETFAMAIKNDTTPIVTFEDGTRALKVALDIVRDIDLHVSKIEKARNI